MLLDLKNFFHMRQIAMLGTRRRLLRSARKALFVFFFVCQSNAQWHDKSRLGIALEIEKIGQQMHAVDYYAAIFL